MSITKVKVNGSTELIPDRSTMGWIKIPTVKVDMSTATKGQLTVSGTGLDTGSTVCCTLTRLERQRSDPSDGIRTDTRFGVSAKSDGTWEVAFDAGLENGFYLLGCHARPVTDSDSDRSQNVYAEVELVNVSTGPRFKPFVSIDPMSSFTSTQVSATGTTFYASNTVTCTLTPIRSDGTSVSPMPMGFPITQNAVTNASDSNAWSVDIMAPSGGSGSGPATIPSGLYLLTAAAPNEGSDSVIGSVQIMM